MSTSGHATTDEILPAFNAWRRSLAQLTGMGLTEEERASTAQALSQEKLKRECKRCESWRDTVIAESELWSGLSDTRKSTRFTANMSTIPQAPS